ncbi:MAG: ATP-dependent DNA helicase UvrD2 [Actinomycetota bacterium]|nr:ATP-dependent DNA helicase UvrD2 [Actinomycetota bacterium]
MPGDLPCAYCGSRHGRAAEVRACWQRSLAGAAPVAPRAELTASRAERTAEPAVARGELPQRAIGAVLGRSVLVAPGQPPPPAWAGCVRWGGGLDELEEAWRTRTPLVIETDEDPPGDEVERRPVWSLSPSFAFPGERRAHAGFANAVDARGGAMRWPLAELAVHLGAKATGPADVVLPDGRPAYLDGGPLAWQRELDGACVIARACVLAGSLAGFGDNVGPADLAPDQLAAVTHPGGAARIVAPAGSGKTRVLTERARHLLRRWNLPASALTLVAFNKRAAQEMRARTADLPELRVQTLNALGLSLVAASEARATIEEREVRSILDTLVDLPRRANSDPAAAWIEALSEVRLGLQPPSAVEAAYRGDVDGLAEVFDRYRAVLAQRQVVDFDEQIYRAIEILLADPATRRRAQAACQFLLVDEFQDLTPAHLLLIRLLAGGDGAVFGVGDDDQTIYGYAHASPEWLIDYRRFFPTAGQHDLEVNYRCPPSVIDAARCLLTHNTYRVDKRIAAAPGRVAQPGEFEVIAGEDPVSATLERVAARLHGGAAPSQVAVLSRVNASLAAVQVGLVHRGFPVQPAVDVTYLARNGVQTALSWLRIGLAAEGRLSGADLADAARRPSRALSRRVVEWIGEQRSIAGLERLARRVAPRDGDKISGFAADLGALRARAVSATTGEVLCFVRDEVGLDRAMELLEGSRRRLDRSAQTDDLDALVALAGLHPEPEGFEDWLRRSLSDRGDPDGVVLSTIHRVKGREWPHVIVHEATAGLLPHRLAEDVEEERRVFHVAITRASCSLVVVAGDPPSPFIADLARAFDPASARRAAPPPASPQRARPDRRPLGRRVTEPAAGAAPSGATGSDEATADQARQALRAWRSERASAEHKPAYVYLHDRTIEALASAMPSTMEQLSSIEGIGPAKREAYGDELLALLARITAETGGTHAP